MTPHTHAAPQPVARTAPCPAGPVRRSLATVVLALVTGLPLGSAGRLVPDAEERDGPYVGV
ncbi:hypothetical protein Q8W71_07685 [Methylobacterium sp. NEAU 140]|uniref:hypothetical protein n=1 Tax=Methylobacterium sp. NEAU 140 TaxID=3064945 RepID=UPI0027335BE3|nr:hypothetical protein [Methylobacterium sp. NEAU 140]MDP4022499.1 hypothetical protein [Methylobacterium sp. NEAU 140]